MDEPLPTPSYSVGSQAPRQAYYRDRIIRTPDTIVRGQLTTAGNTTVYTAPTNSSGVGSLGADLVLIVLSNSDTVARTIAMHFVESGGAVAANRLILPTVSIPANQSVFVSFDGDQGYLEPGEFVNLIAGTANTIQYRVVALRLTS